jgi:GNAT superfamily N-acetyltransferase
VIHIREMTLGDVQLGMRLKTQAGWNQVEEDWRRMRDMQPDGCFVAEFEGVPVGTTNTCIFDSVAWIAMVLVDAELRSKGIGKAMMVHALSFLDGKGVPTIRLDATPMGQPLYEKLGFVEEYRLIRYDGVLALPPKLQSDSRLRRVHDDEVFALDQIIELDRQVTSTNRRKLLSRLCLANPSAVRWVESGERLLGYMTVREGSSAVQLGPCIAEAEAGPLLLTDTWERYVGHRVFIDIPTGNVSAVRMAEAMGLKAQRTLVRMCRGVRITEDFTQLWASSGPELG